MSFDPFRSYTQARIGLGHKAPALPTKAWLEFAYHHACAVDAVRMPWQVHEQAQELTTLGHACEILSTNALNRTDYLMRPDHGRTLSSDSQKRLLQIYANPTNIVIVLSNGLSSQAMHHHAVPFISNLLEYLAQEQLQVSMPLLLVENARVALLDHIGDLTQARLGIVIIGERPGLSAPDSLAVYLTYQPRLGLSDAARNCISNIRPPFGLSYDVAAKKVSFLIHASLTRKLSGVQLKEEALVEKIATLK